MDDFPEFCIRGIQKIDHIYPDDRVKSTLFKPDNRTSQKRIDRGQEEGQETSINWEDNETVLEFTLDLKDDGKPNALAFPHGAVKLPKAVLDNIINTASNTNMIFYEREKLDHNIYHGNIVFRSGIPEHLITMMLNTFALYCSPVIRKKTTS